MENNQGLHFTDKNKELKSNKSTREKLLKNAQLKMLQPNANSIPPIQQPENIETGPTRRPRSFNPQKRYEPITIHAHEWTEKQLQDFMSKRFPQ